ncbi:hypothetical protein ED733_000883 [Metarhizium rileyi]|uniref:Ribosomal protein L37ae n=1 Tax=Metarhizium rileyi (strain RCEF 4871) TaxID=1649241 RepID=A0A5C6GJ64_METRR|nr:hypothetical protein ED733_000883 [Metarhizium rileyi]
MNEPEQCIICLDPLPHPSSLASPHSPSPSPSPSPINGAGTTGAAKESADTASSTRQIVAADAVAEDVNNLDIVAALDGCEHVIHDACIRSWAQKTNTCPICRTPFHFVRVYNGVDGTVISTYDVIDKKQVAEFDVQAWLGENVVDDEEEEGNPCPICNSAEREDILLLCDSCDAAYHTHCIGLDHVPDGDWYCMECAHLFQLTEDRPEQTSADPESPRPQVVQRPHARDVRGFHVRTRQRLRRARRQARNAEWQGAWGQFSGRFYEMSDLDLDNHDDEDEDLEQYRRFQQLEQLDRRELDRWQQRMDIANRLGARETFASTIPPQISELLQAPLPPVEETRDERRAWGAFDRAREAEIASNAARKRKSRSVTASPAEPAQEPERKLKRPRTRRLPTQAEASTSVPSPVTSGPSNARPATTSTTATVVPTTNGINGTNRTALRNGITRMESATPLVSSLLKELEPNPLSEDETPALTPNWRVPPEASSPALSPSPSNHSSPRALSLTPPPLPSLNGRPTSPTLSLSTHIEPRYRPANYSPTRFNSDHGDSDSRSATVDSRPLELRQPRPRRAHQVPPRAEESSPTRWTMTQEEKKSINEIVKSALRPHWRAQKLTTEQYATINRDISRKLYDEVKDAASLDEESRRTWEKRATQEVAQAVAELSA